MKRFKIMGLATVAVLASAMALAGTASAATLVKFIDPKGEVPVGTVITATSHNLTTTTSAGILECETDELPGTLENNNASKVHAVSNASLNYGNFEEALVGPGACKTSVGIPVFIETSEFPWPNEFKVAKGVGAAETKGTKKVAFTSTYAYPPLGENNKCEFEASSIKSKFAAGTPGHPVPVELETENGKFKLNKKLPHTASICPKEGLLNGDWTEADANGTVEEE